MLRINDLEGRVRTLYAQKNPSGVDWVGWLWTGHVLPVANYAGELARRFGANYELSRAAALLHDIADVQTKRSDPKHEQLSLELGRQLLQESGFSEEEIRKVVDDAVKRHSCHGNERPQTLEGKVLATADAMAHFKTGFYDFAEKEFGMTGQEFKDWVREKIDRDLNKKCFFEEVRLELKPYYDRLKARFCSS